MSKDDLVLVARARGWPTRTCRKAYAHDPHLYRRGADSFGLKAYCPGNRNYPEED